MKKENRDLLESLIEMKLKQSMENGELNPKAFEEAMKAIDRQLEIDKREAEMQRDELKINYDKEKENNRQQFELEKENNRQQFEIDKEDKRQSFELNKETLKHNAEDKRHADDRDHEFNLEIIKQKFKMKEMNFNGKIEKFKADLEADEAAKQRMIKYAEIALAVIVTPMIEAGCKHAFAKMICEFEKDYNFTTMAGKTLNSLFKFKR